MHRGTRGAQQWASILNVAVTSLLGLSVKLPSADPVIVYLPPTPVTSALPMSPQEVPEKPAKSRKSTDLTVTSPPVSRTAVKPFALSGVSMVHAHPVCVQCHRVRIAGVLAVDGHFRRGAAKRRRLPTAAGQSQGEHRRGHRNVSGLHVAKLY